MSAPRPLVLVTCDQHPDLPEDDRTLLAPLRAAGFEPHIFRWKDESVRWRDWPLIVLRAPWDYHLELGAFLAWMEARQTEGAQLLNPLPAVRWNADKRYLRELEAQGIPIVETRFVEPSEHVTLAQVVAERGWTEAVVKPSISAGAYQTERFGAAQVEAHEPLLREIVKTGAAALVQPYLKSVEQDGEWSFFFFNRKLSHVLVKRPQAGDFRVQEQYGGTAHNVALKPGQLEAAARVVEAVPGPLLYARVDGFFIQGQFQLGELEIIEPSLFLHHAPHAPALYAKALVELIPAGNSW